MQFLDFKSLLYSDTLIPDIFISEYMPALKGEYVKLYIYCVFLAKHLKTPPVSDLARTLDMPVEKVRAGLVFLDNQGLLTWSDDGVVLKDLKEKEIDRLYRLKTISTPEEASESSRVNEERRQAITAINNMFFSGVMSPSWYLDIDTWFDKYRFDEDVMLMLFKHCEKNNGLARQYVAKVAENWNKKGIHNSYDVEDYLQEYERFKDIREKIRRRMKQRKPLDEYQERIVEKWVSEYKFSFDIIDLALKNSIHANDPGLSYFDTILGDWRKRGIDTVEKVEADQAAYIKARKAGKKAPEKKPGNILPDSAQRKYDDDVYDKFVSNKFGAGNK
ncbi:MAG: DnaD domain protein [Oscillospiraceae bacterium]|nr:DnaD domain protein [Oscillospiraceae bacterium]